MKVAVEYDDMPEINAPRDYAPPPGGDEPPPRPSGEYIKAPNGQPKPLLANVLTYLRASQEWQGIIGFDQFALQTMLLGSPPWEGRRNQFEPRAWTELDDVLATNLVQHQGICVSVDIVQSAIETFAKEQSFHPVADYLDGLQWDGRGRIGKWLSTYLGAVDTLFTEAVGSRFMISAVARIMRPGCKVDTMLVLEGKQGAGKSKTVKALGDPWTSDELADFGSKDAAMQMRSCWLMEVPELDAMSRAEVTRVKAFLSRSSDRYRPPYGRRVIEVPRQSVLIGTTNAETYLKDETGGRRFWPIVVGDIDHRALARDRDQLWAEAVHDFRNGATWWLDSHQLEVEAAAVQAERLVEDPWSNRIAEAVARGIRDTSIGQLLEDVVEIKSDRWTQLEQNRVARILRSLGFERYQKRVGGERVWRYRRQEQ